MPRLNAPSGRNAAARGTGRRGGVSNIAAGSPAEGVTIFYDGFESGDLTHTEGGISWNAGTRTSVVSGTSYSGTYSLALAYQAAASGSDSWAEQGFSMGATSETWLEYMLLVPSNFVHRNDSPNNNKFCQFSYNSATSQMMTVEYERETDTTSGFRRFLSTSEECDGSPNWPISTSGVSNVIGSGYYIEPGTWAQIRVHYKAASACEVMDGRFEVWVDGVSVHSLDWAVWDDTYSGQINGGYLMGWANSGFAAETIFHVDDVKFYSSDPGW